MFSKLISSELTPVLKIPHHQSELKLPTFKMEPITKRERFCTEGYRGIRRRRNSIASQSREQSVLLKLLDTPKQISVLEAHTIFKSTT